MSSTKLILNLILSFLKLIFFFISKWMKGKMEEKIRYQERMNNLKDLMDKISKDNSEVTNESDYLSNLVWEEIERFNEYSRQLLTILNSGGGIEQMKNTKILGMHLRVARKENLILDIIKLAKSNEEKSKMIARELARNE
jgi:hypothetical protein